MNPDNQQCDDLFFAVLFESSRLRGRWMPARVKSATVNPRWGLGLAAILGIQVVEPLLKACWLDVRRRRRNGQG
jgi:hypothetical protein